MKHLLLAILILLTATVHHGEAAATPTPLTSDCRYLFVVDTSFSMSRLQDQITSSLQRMVTSGLDGQMSPGEVFTIWTFNEAVYQRDYPLNSWRPELNQSMGSRVRQYMQSQRFRREPNMRALLNALNQARQICPRIAIFLVSNGQEVLVGTPFDRNINVSYGRRFAELRAARVPFVTTLVCQDGEFVSWNVNAANEPINIPLGPDGNLVVGRPKQITTMGPTPVMTTNRPPVVPVVTQGTNNVPKSAVPVMPVVTNQSTAKQINSRPGVITVPGPPPTPRKVVELTPKSRNPDKPRVVKPTDIAPSPKRTSPVFRKTNEVKAAVAKVIPEQTNAAPVVATNAPATNAAPKQVAKANLPSRPRASAIMTVKSNRPAPKPAPRPTPPPARQTTNTATVPPVPKPPTLSPVAVPKPEPEVVIQVVTQIVMVPLPAITPEKTSPAPAPVVEERKPEPKPTPVVKTNSPPAVPAVTNVAVAEAPKTNTPPAPTPGAPPVETNIAAAPAPTPPPTPPAEPNNIATLLGPNSQNMTAWLFLAGGILALLIVIAAVRRLVATRSGETSMISQSMERRDNG